MPWSRPLITPLRSPQVPTLMSEGANGTLFAYFPVNTYYGYTKRYDYGSNSWLT